MKSCTLPALAVILVANAGEAAAQGQVAPRPATSPYLNLLRGGNPTYLNYYGLVRPQQQAQAGFAGLQQQLTASNQATQNAFDLLGQNTGEVMTGTGAGFMNHRTYFMTTGSGGAGFGTNRIGGVGMGGFGAGGVGAGRVNPGAAGLGMVGGGRGGAAIPRR